MIFFKALSQFEIIKNIYNNLFFAFSGGQI